MVDVVVVVVAAKEEEEGVNRVRKRATPALHTVDHLLHLLAIIMSVKVTITRQMDEISGCGKWQRNHRATQSNLLVLTV